MTSPGYRWLFAALAFVAFVGCGPSRAASGTSSDAGSSRPFLGAATGHPALHGTASARERLRRIRDVQTLAGPAYHVDMVGDAARFHGVGLQLDHASDVTSRATQGNRVELRRGDGMTEWYQSGPLGLEQGFEVARPTRDGDIVIDVSITGAKPIQAGDREVALVNPAGRVVARYGEAFALDAHGLMVPVRLAARDHGLELHVATRGAVFPVEIDPLVWVTQAKLVASDRFAYDDFGQSAALSGDTALIGADRDDNFAGAAYVFVRSGSAWSEQQKLVPADIAADAAGNPSVGRAVAIDTDTALVGTLADAAYVYIRSGGVWTEQQRLVASAGAPFDRFGGSVALSGDTALVGADAEGPTGTAHVFTRSGDVWTEEQTLLPSDGVAGDGFGRAVALSGNTAIVAAPARNSNIGAAYVFVRSGTVWTEQQELTSGSSQIKWFGSSVAVDGDTTLVGAPSDVYSTGRAFVFVRSGTTWSKEQTLVPPSGFSLEPSFGRSVAVSLDTALIGVPDSGNTGTAYVFSRVGTVWTQQQRLSAYDYQSAHLFGRSVSLSGSTALLGAPGDDSQAGAAYAFVLSDPFPNGSPCPDGSFECASGYCVDGYCCANACDQVCQTCAATPGTCTPVTSADDVDTCTGTNSCDTYGVCVKKNGKPCSLANECVSGFCVDGHCCNSACTGACENCSSNPGTCTPAAGGYDAPPCAPYRCDGVNRDCPTSCSHTMCKLLFYCDASKACVPVQAPGAPCTVPEQCLSNHCVDGVCCDTACTGWCEACDGATPGTCTAVVGAPHHGPCTGAGGPCGGLCDGQNRQLCTYPGEETTCGTGTCGGGAERIRACDGAGTCRSLAPKLCSPYACGSTACNSSCTDSTDCATGYACTGGACSLPGADAGADTGAAGAGTAGADGGLDDGGTSGSAGTAGSPDAHEDGGPDAAGLAGSSGSGAADSGPAGAGGSGAIAGGDTIEAGGGARTSGGGPGAPASLTGDTGGCGCRATPEPGAPPWFVLLSLGVLATGRRARARSRSGSRSQRCGSSTPGA